MNAPFSLARHAALSGYRPLYRTGTRCPSCGGSAWHVGRLSAECGQCATALPLAPRAPETDAG